LEKEMVNSMRDFKRVKPGHVYGREGTLARGAIRMRMASRSRRQIIDSVHSALLTISCEERH
jgi:hypothetical protein